MNAGAAGSSARRSENLLLLGVGSAAVGDGLRVAALPIVALRFGATPTQLGLLLGVGTLPFLFAGIAGGVLADRLEQLRWLRVLDLVRAVAVGAFAVLLVIGAPAAVLPAAFAVTLIIGSAEALALPAFFSVVPAVVAQRSLAQFNGTLSAVQQVGRDFAGPLIGALLAAQATASLPFGVNAATFLLSYLALTMVRRSPGAAGAGVPRDSASVLAGLAQAARLLRRSPVLLLMGLGAVFINFGIAAGLATHVVFLTRGLGADPSAYGAFLASSAVGGILGGWVLLRRWPGLAVPRRLPLVTAFLTLGFWVLAAAPNVPVAMVCAGVLGGATTLYTATSRTLRQRLIPDGWRGRVEALYRTAAFGALPVGSVVGGVLADGVGVRAPSVLAGFGALIAALLLVPGVRRLRVDPVGERAGTGDGPSSADRSGTVDGSGSADRSGTADGPGTADDETTVAPAPTRHTGPSLAAPDLAGADVASAAERQDDPVPRPATPTASRHPNGPDEPGGPEPRPGGS